MFVFSALVFLAGWSQAFSLRSRSPAVASRIHFNQRHQQHYLPTTTSATTTTTTTSLSMGLMDNMQQFIKRFTTKATASHILMRGGAEAEFKLQDLKEEIADSPVKFAEYATKLSECPSASRGGSLGEFGPGAMVKEFNDVVFDPENDAGKVYGPVKTQFGYHLIYIADRTE